MDLDGCSEAMEEGLEGKTKGACGDDSPIATFMDSPSRLPDILPSNSVEKIPERATGLLISNLFFNSFKKERRKIKLNEEGKNQKT